MEDLQPYSMNGTIHPFLCEELGGFLGLHDAHHRFAVIADGVDGLEGTIDDLKLEEGVGKGFETGPILVAIQLAKGVLQLHAQDVVVDRNSYTLWSRRYCTALCVSLGTKKRWKE